ncbi:hypothetical protein LXL04_021043 [Taraxacum kok-saghyz]
MMTIDDKRPHMACEFLLGKSFIYALPPHQDLLRTHIFPRTPKPLTFSKNRLRGSKNRSNLRSIYNTYLKGFVKKNLKKNAKKKLHICKNKKKVAHMQKLKKISFFSKFFSANFNDSKRFEESRSRFFERNNGLGDIGNWGSSRALDPAKRMDVVWGETAGNFTDLGTEDEIRRRFPSELKKRTGEWFLPSNTLRISEQADVAVAGPSSGCCGR